MWQEKRFLSMSLSFLFSFYFYIGLFWHFHVEACFRVTKKTSWYLKMYNDICKNNNNKYIKKYKSWKYPYIIIIPLDINFTLLVS